jgi:hypothetical protein
VRLNAISLCSDGFLSSGSIVKIWWLETRNALLDGAFAPIRIPACAIRFAPSQLALDP